MRIPSSCFHRVSSAKGAPAPLLVPEIWDRSATGQSLCHHGFLVSSPAGRPSVLSCVCHCHRLSPLGSPGVLRGTAPAAGIAGAWKPRVPCGGCGGWQQCWRVKDQGSKFANDPLSHFQKRTSHQHLSVPSL